MRSLLLVVLLAFPALAAPPTLEIPAELRPVGDYVTLKPKTADAVSVTYVGLSKVDAFPSAFLKDPKDFILPVRGLAEGRYSFAAVASSKEGEQARFDFVVVIGTPPKDPPVIVPPPVDPPVTPPTGALYFLIVRSDGPADPAFTKAMGDPAWAELRKAGHQVKDKTLTEAAALGLSFADGTKLPCVVTLRETADGTKHKVARDAIALPTTGDGIRKLPEGVK